MNTLSKAVIVALVVGGSISTAVASPRITDIVASGPGLGSFEVLSNTTTPNMLDLSKAFDSVNPITLTFTVVHDTGTGSPYNVTEAITNNTTTPFSDFHFNITEPTNAPGNGVVFTSHNSSTLDGFTLDSGASSPRNLSFTGALAVGNSANAGFNLSPFDPGAGNSYTFTLTQTPTVSPIPEPETYAMLLAGLILMGSIAKRRSNKS